MCVPGMSANANCNDHPVQNPHNGNNGGDPTGSSSQPAPSGSRCISCTAWGCRWRQGVRLHASDFLTPTQGQALVNLMLVFVNLAGGSGGGDMVDLGPQIKEGSSGGPTAGKAFPRPIRQQALEENPSTCVYCRMQTNSPRLITRFRERREGMRRSRMRRRLVGGATLLRVLVSSR